MDQGGSEKIFLDLKVELTAVVFVLAALSKLTPGATEIVQPQSAKMLAAERGNPGFISIDCGAAEDYYDKQLGLTYKTDAGFIDTGINRQISPKYAKDKQLNNVRSFPNGTRNCYTLRPSNGRNSRYFIRTSFVYGNYDGRNEIPYFDLYVGVDKWRTVEIGDPSVRYDYGVIHVPSQDYIDVCLVKTGFGVPFISVLELRPLDSGIYQTQFRSLVVYLRVYFGQTIVRHPDDVYDRLWSPSRDFPDSVPVNSSVPISREQSLNDTYKLPGKVLSSAIQSRDASTPLKFVWNNTNSTWQWFFCLYINEIEKLEQGKQRELVVDIDNESSETLKLEYLKPVVILSPSPMTGTTVNFTISARGNSDLPAILNAFEVLKAVEFSSPTAEADANAVHHIKNVYRVIRESWQGDPCVPVDYSWEGLRCSNSEPPRIISLNLSSSNLIGQIASSLVNLTAIECLDLSNNKLSGKLPEFLAKLPNLKVLNLTRNNLSGPVPNSLKEKSRSQKLQLRLEENPDLCPNDVCQISETKERQKSRKKYVVPLVASIVSALLLILLTAAVIFWKVKMKKQDVTINFNNKEQLVSRGRKFLYTDILNITNNFETIIGEGGFGKVYYGSLHDGAQLLLIVHHRNLVTLIGYCDEAGNKALVYEYMAYGNLRKYLSEANPDVLQWERRLQIAIDAAQGLEYLHNGCKPPIIHGDLKASNILLDWKMQAKISDFGLSKVFETETQTHLSTRIAGTPGYVDPEYRGFGKLTKKSDVYSFGIILLELITGQPAILTGDNESIHIVDWVRPMIERGDIGRIVDSRLEGKFNQNSAWKSVEVAMACFASTSIQRSDMSLVLADLKECLKLEMMVPERNLATAMSINLCEFV